MAIKDLLVQVKAAQDAGDIDTADRIIESVESMGIKPQAFADYYKKWRSSGQAVEPTPTRQIAQGAQLGFADELAGFGSALGKFAAGDTNFSENYKARRDAEREANKLYQASNPGRSFALQAAGGLLVPVKGKAPAMSAPARVGHAARTGAAYGATAGLGMGEGDIVDQAISTGAGGILGGIVGAGISGLAEGGRAGARAIANRGKVAIQGGQPAAVVETLTPEGAPIPTFTPSQDVSVSAMDSAKRKVLDALIKDGMTPEQARQEIAARALDTSLPSSKPITIADISPAGGAVQRTARGARVNAPAGAGRADAFLSARDRLQGSRVLSDLNQTSGLPDEAPMVTKQRIETAARDASREPYKAVREAGEINIAKIEPYVNTPWFQSARAHVESLPQFKGKNINDAEVLDEMYKFLQGSRNGETNPRVVDAIKGVMGSIKESIDDATGGMYSKATSGYHAEIKNRDAMELGGNIFNKSAATMKAEMSKLDGGQQEVYRSAAADAIRERLRGLSFNRDAVKAMFNNDAIVSKIRMVFPDDASFRNFERQMVDEAKMVSTKQVLTGNSQTADKLRDAIDAGGYVDVLAGAVTDPVGAATNVARKVATDKIAGMLPGAEARGEGIMSMLLNPDAGANISLLDELIKMQARQQAINSGSAAVQRPLITSGATSLQGLVPR